MNAKNIATTSTRSFGVHFQQVTAIFINDKSSSLSVVFFPDRVSKLRAPWTKCTVLYSEKITANKADSSAYGLSTVMQSCRARIK